jgi:hypothetical protein
MSATTAPIVCLNLQLHLAESEVERLVGVADKEGISFDDLLSRRLDRAGLRGVRVIADPEMLDPYELAKCLLLAEAGIATQLRLLYSDDPMLQESVQLGVDLICQAARESVRRIHLQ